MIDLKIPGLTEDQNRSCLAIMGILVLAILEQKPYAGSKHPPIHGRRNGPWRGKGSFGHGFGSQVSHKR